MFWIAVSSIVAGLAAVAFVIIRKLPLLANIDIEQIAAERQAAVKKRLINEKLKRQVFGIAKKAWGFLKPLATLLLKALMLIYDKLVNLKAGYERTEKLKDTDFREQVEIMFAEAEEWLRKGELNKSESKLIEVIGLDPKNHKAFELLGEMYFDKGSYQEAEESLTHAVKLLTQAKRSDIKNGYAGELSRAYYHLALIAASIGDHVKSLANLKSSLELEPNSPRYLDKACEICLNLKDGSGALEYCRHLERVNPGNKKLKELKDRIRDLAKETDRREVENSISEAI